MQNGRAVRDLSSSWITSMIPSRVFRSLSHTSASFPGRRSSLVASRKSTFPCPGSASTQSPFTAMMSRGSLVVLWPQKSWNTGDKLLLSFSPFKTQTSAFDAVRGMQYKSTPKHRRKKKTRKEKRRIDHHRRDQQLRVGISRAPSPQALHAFLTKEGGSFFNVRVVATAFLALSKVMQDEHKKCLCPCSSIVGFDEMIVLLLFFGDT
jgi:hypothetical protein